MGDWETKELEDCLSAIIDYRGKTPNKTASGIPLITAKIVKNGRIDTPNEFIAAKDYAAWMTRGLPRVGDVLLTVEAPLGEVAQVTDERIALAQRIILLRGKEGYLDSSYLKYYLISDFGQSELFSRQTGTTVFGIKQSELRKIKITFPPIEEQKTIAKILSAFDDKIELNRRMNATLEAMARALFKAWFVDFEPVHANRENRPSTSASPEIAKLFPSTFENGIPKGWTEDSIYEVSKVVYGAPFASDRFNSEKVGKPLIRIRDLTTNKPQVFTDETHPKGTLISAGDVVVGMDGEFRSYWWLGRAGWLNQRVCLFEPRHPANSVFVKLSIEQQLDFFERAKVGTTVIHLGKSDIDRMKSLIPNPQIVAEFSRISDTFLSKMVINAKESSGLTEIRDALLPRLISGKTKF